MSHQFTPEQLYKIAKILENRNYGGFFSAIGCALQLADSDNTRRLIEAFGDKFEIVLKNALEAEKLEA
jgi:hypothetical protein